MDLFGHSEGQRGQVYVIKDLVRGLHGFLNDENRWDDKWVSLFSTHYMLSDTASDIIFDIFMIFQCFWFHVE